MSPFHTSSLVVSVFTDTFSLVSVFWTRFCLFVSSVCLFYLFSVFSLPVSPLFFIYSRARASRACVSFQLSMGYW